MDNPQVLLCLLYSSYSRDKWWSWIPVSVIFSPSVGNQLKQFTSKNDAFLFGCVIFNAEELEV